MKVLKFGGTSLGDAGRMQQVAQIIENENECIVVCSAMAGVTNRLLEISECWQAQNMPGQNLLLDALLDGFRKTAYGLFADTNQLHAALNDINQWFSGPEIRLKKPWSQVGEKWLLAQGEVATTSVFFRYLNEVRGLGFVHLNALDFMQKRSDGEPDLERIRTQLIQLIHPGGSGRYLTQGYICRNFEGFVDNLARGGGDYTATLLGAAADADVVEIWSDIDGLHQADPRIVEGTAAIRELSFEEAAELAYFGAKILHPTCVWPAASKGIPIILKNTFDPLAPGTIIKSNLQPSGIRAMAAKSGITIVRIKSSRMLNAFGYLRRIFEIFELFQTPVDVVTTSEVSVSVTLDNDLRLDEITDMLHELGEVEVERNQAIVCVVGDILARDKGMGLALLRTIRNIDIKMVSFGGNMNNFTFVVPEDQKNECLRSLHHHIFCRQPSFSQPLSIH